MANLDGLENVLTGQGTAKYDPDRSTVIGATYYLTQQSQDNYVEQFRYCRKVVEFMPNAMCFRWGKFNATEADPDAANTLADKMKRFSFESDNSISEYQSVRKLFLEAQKIANKTGNCGAVLHVNDGNPDDFSQPINLNRLESVTGATLLDRWQLQKDVSKIASNQKIEHYWYQSNYGELGDRNGMMIHKSRVLWFRGDQLYGNSLLSNNGCDLSLLDTFIPAFHRFMAGIASLSKMLHNNSVMQWKIKGLLTELAGNPAFEETLKQRMALNSSGSSVYRTVVADLEDEDINFLERSNMRGVSDSLETLFDDLIASTPNLTKPILKGEFVVGLGADGSGSRLLWNDRVAEAQSDKFTANIEYLINLFLQSNEFSQYAGIDWGWEWLPVYPTTEPEKAEIKSKFAAIAAQLQQVDPRIAKALIASQYGSAEFDPNGHLPPELVESLLDESIEAATQKTIDARDLIELPGDASPPDPGELNRLSKVNPDDVAAAVAAFGAATPPKYRNLIDPDIRGNDDDQETVS